MHLPTPLPFEPWWNLYLPALLGQRAFVDRAVEAVLNDPPTADALAVAARALFVRQDVFRAERLATASITRGGYEADRLAVNFAVDGRHRAEALIDCAARPSTAADVACDLAGRCLAESDLRGARDAVNLALDRAPEHAEARHWARFFADAADPMACASLAVRAQERTGPAPVTHRDAFALMPTRLNGFVSRERWQRRHAGEMMRARRGSGADRLREAGVPRPRIVSDRLLSTLPAEDPRVDLEILADDAASLVAEGRSAVRATKAMLADARRFSPTEQSAAARLAASLAARDPALRPGALDAAERLLPLDPCAWTPWVALLGADSRPERSLRLARGVLTDPQSTPEAFLLAVDALRRCGYEDEARAVAVNALDKPGYRSVATRAIQRAESAAP